MDKLVLPTTSAVDCGREWFELWHISVGNLGGKYRERRQSGHSFPLWKYENMNSCEALKYLTNLMFPSW